MATPALAVFDWNKALRLYRHGWKYRDIAAKLGCSYKSLQRELKARGAEPSNRKHERTARPLGPRLYRTWRQLRRRCERPADKDYAKFGGRGIRVAPAWRSFDAFYDWAIAAGYRAGLHLDRHARVGNFTPANCCWVEAGGLRIGVTVGAQVLIEGFGDRKSRAAWSRDRRCRVSKIALYERLASGWPPEEAVSAPPRSSPSRRIEPVVVPERHRARRRVDWSRALALHRKEGFSEDRIARRFGVTRGAVLRGLRLRGVRRRQEPTDPTKHERDRLHHCWSDMHRRCTDPRNSQFRFVGGKGIRVSREWQKFEPFLLWAQVHGARRGLWLVRKDARENWSPRNCEWVKPSVARQRERPHAMPPPKRLVTAFGETKSVAEWGKDSRCTVRDFTISRRLDRGWRPEDAISGPPANSGTTGTQLVLLRAFGQEKSKREWLIDPRCAGIGHVALDLRLAQGWSAEDAISTPPWRHPGSRRAAGE